MKQIILTVLFTSQLFTFAAKAATANPSIFNVCFCQSGGETGMEFDLIAKNYVKDPQTGRVGISTQILASFDHDPINLGCSRALYEHKKQNICPTSN